MPIKVASTFPGFCNEHEQLFQVFESERKLSLDGDFALQAYRATCREVVRLRIQCDYIRESGTTFLGSLVDSLIATEIGARLSGSGISVAQGSILEVLSEIAAPSPNGLNELIEIALSDLDVLQSEHQKMFEDVIFLTWQ